MNLLKLQGINFTTHTNTIVAFNNNGFYVIVGKTGSGKTSLLDIVSYTFFGKTPRGEGDELVRKGTNQMKTGVLFESNGKHYQAIRKRVLGKSTALRLSEIKGKDLTGKTIKETQRRLERIIGLDYELYKMSVCFEQGKSNTFNILTPTSAKTSLMKLLQLDTYKNVSQKIREELSEFTSRENAYITETDSIENQIKEFKVPKTTVEVDLIKLEDQLVKLELIIGDLNKQRDTKYKQYTGVSSKIKANAETVKTLRKELQKIKQFKTSCPLCEQELTDETKGKVLRNKAEKINNIDKIVETLSIESEKLIGHYNKIEDNIKKGEQKYEELSSTKKELGVKETEHISTKKTIDTLKKTLTELKKKTETVKEKIGTYLYLKEAFGKNGIQVYIINKVIPEIEYVANDLINDITGGRLNIELRTQVEGKGGELLDTFRIIVTDDLVERQYSTYSGGEKFIIDFSIRLALSILLSHRTGFKIDTVIIDEGFSGLDEDNQRLVLSAINKTITKYSLKKVILITHIEDISETIENRINVTKENDISKVI